MGRLLSLGLFAILVTHASAQDRAEANYRRYCARCHESEKAGHTPDIRMLREMSAEAVLASMEADGTMATIARPMGDEQRRALAEFVSGKKRRNLTPRTGAPTAAKIPDFSGRAPAPASAEKAAGDGSIL